MFPLRSFIYGGAFPKPCKSMDVFITAIKSAFVPSSPRSQNINRASTIHTSPAQAAVQSLLRLCLIILLLICLCAWKEPSQSARGPFYSKPSEEALSGPTPGVMLMLYVNLTWQRDARIAAKTVFLLMSLSRFPEQICA